MGIQQFYRTVTAQGTGGTSGGGLIQLPLPATGISTSKYGYSGIKVKWRKQSDDVDGYKLGIKKNGYPTVAEIISGGTEYELGQTEQLFPSLDAGAEYGIWVLTKDSEGNYQTCRFAGNSAMQRANDMLLDTIIEMNLPDTFISGTTYYFFRSKDGQTFCSSGNSAEIGLYMLNLQSGLWQQLYAYGYGWNQWFEGSGGDVYVSSSTAVADNYKILHISKTDGTYSLSAHATLDNQYNFTNWYECENGLIIARGIGGNGSFYLCDANGDTVSRLLSASRDAYSLHNTFEITSDAFFMTEAGLYRFHKSDRTFSLLLTGYWCSFAMYMLSNGNVYVTRTYLDSSTYHYKIALLNLADYTIAYLPTTVSATSSSFGARIAATIYESQYNGKVYCILSGRGSSATYPSIKIYELVNNDIVFLTSYTPPTSPASDTVTQSTVTAELSNGDFTIQTRNGAHCVYKMATGTVMATSKNRDPVTLVLNDVVYYPHGYYDSTTGIFSYWINDYTPCMFEYYRDSDGTYYAFGGNKTYVLNPDTNELTQFISGYCAPVRENVSSVLFMGTLATNTTLGKTVYDKASGTFSVSTTNFGGAPFGSSARPYFVNQTLGKVFSVGGETETDGTYATIMSPNENYSYSYDNVSRLLLLNIPTSVLGEITAEPHNNFGEVDCEEYFSDSVAFSGFTDATVQRFFRSSSGDTYMLSSYRTANNTREDGVFRLTSAMRWQRLYSDLEVYQSPAFIEYTNGDIYLYDMARSVASASGSKTLRIRDGVVTSIGHCGTGYNHDNEQYYETMLEQNPCFMQMFLSSDGDLYGCSATLTNSIKILHYDAAEDCFKTLTCEGVPLTSPAYATASYFFEDSLGAVIACGAFGSGGLAIITPSSITAMENGLSYVPFYSASFGYFLFDEGANSTGVLKLWNSVEGSAVIVSTGTNPLGSLALIFDAGKGATFFSAWDENYNEYLYVYDGTTFSVVGNVGNFDYLTQRIRNEGMAIGNHYYLGGIMGTDIHNNYVAFGASDRLSYDGENVYYENGRKYGGDSGTSYSVLYGNYMNDGEGNLYFSAPTFTRNVVGGTLYDLITSTDPQSEFQKVCKYNDSTHQIDTVYTGMKDARYLVDKGEEIIFISNGPTDAKQVVYDKTTGNYTVSERKGGTLIGKLNNKPYFANLAEKKLYPLHGDEGGVINVTGDYFLDYRCYSDDYMILFDVYNKKILINY